MSTGHDLADACAAWQGGRDAGSSPIRAAARLLTGTGHYFRAPYITELEREAEHHDATMERARVLLAALAAAPRRDASGWSTSVGLAGSWAGRGIGSKVAFAEDQQILESLTTGSIAMPLWGVSLDRNVAEQFGTRFTFELVGEFPAIPAWMYSGIKGDEQELVVGGRYRVADIDHSVGDDRTAVRLEFLSADYPPR